MVEKAVRHGVSCSTYIDIANIACQTDRKELLEDIDVPNKNITKY